MGSSTHTMFIRHGPRPELIEQTASDLSPSECLRYRDVSLSTEGSAWVSGLPLGDNWTKVVSSPYLRCLQTAWNIATRLGVHVSIDRRLAEKVDQIDTPDSLVIGGRNSFQTHDESKQGATDFVLNREPGTIYVTHGYFLSIVANWKHGVDTMHAFVRESGFNELAIDDVAIGYCDYVML